MQTFIEVAYDESGFSGANLLDPVNRVFTHASVRLTLIRPYVDPYSIWEDHSSRFRLAMRDIEA
jgi:hypothetical protein